MIYMDIYHKLGKNDHKHGAFDITCKDHKHKMKYNCLDANSPSHWHQQEKRYIPCCS